MSCGQTTGWIYWSGLPRSDIGIPMLDITFDDYELLKEIVDENDFVEVRIDERGESGLLEVCRHPGYGVMIGFGAVSSFVVTVLAFAR